MDDWIDIDFRSLSSTTKQGTHPAGISCSKLMIRDLKDQYLQVVSSSIPQLLLLLKYGRCRPAYVCVEQAAIASPLVTHVLPDPYATSP